MFTLRFNTQYFFRVLPSWNNAAAKVDLILATPSSFFAPKKSQEKCFLCKQLYRQDSVAKGHLN
jgi:hypothetical protein